MNSTPSDEAAGPSPDPTAPDAGSRSGEGSDAVPGPRSGPRPLPRRTRGVAGSAQAPEPEPARDPEGRPLRPVDEETLNRLLSGLRDI